jgi:hypothetical protein
MAVPIAALAAPGTAVEFFNASMGHYFVTAFPEEAAAIDNGKVVGWQRTGFTFPVEMSAVAGSQPVCRFFTEAFAPKSSHFYTPNAGECASLKSNPVWQYEAIAFHLALPDASGNCAAGATPIYRFYNDGTTGAPNHRYTADALVVKAMKAQGWTQEGNGATGVFACGPAAPATKTSLAVKIEFNPGVRFLNTADGAALTSQTDTALTFARPVTVFAGDVFVLPEIGAWRALSVEHNGAQTIVGVRPASLTELFAELDIEGTVDIADVPEVVKSAAAGGEPHSLSKALLSTETETTFVVTVNENGDKGGKFTTKLQAACGSNSNIKMRLLEFTGEVYGLQTVKFSLKDPAGSKWGPFTYKITGGAYIGCKLSLPLGKPIRILDLPIPYTAGVARFQLFAKARLDTDIAPVLQIFEAEIGGTVPTASNGPALRTTNPTLAQQLLEGASIGDTFSATLKGEIDASLKIIVPITSTYVLGGGVKTGPVIDVKAAALAKPSGASVDVCIELKWAAELYTEYLSGAGLQHKTFFETEHLLPSPANWKQCAAGNEPSGDWRFTTRTCVTDPISDPTCNYKCQESTDFTLAANPTKSQIDQFFPVGSSNKYMTLLPQDGAPRMYLGSVSEGGGVQVQTIQFGSDWKTADWGFAVVYPSGAGICSIQQSGDAVLTKVK